MYVIDDKIKGNEKQRHFCFDRFVDIFFYTVIIQFTLNRVTSVEGNKFSRY